MDSYGRIGLNDYTTYHKHGYFIGTIRFLTNGTLPTLRRYLATQKKLFYKFMPPTLTVGAVFLPCTLGLL
jgi:hypothetical protein